MCCDGLTRDQTNYSSYITDRCVENWTTSNSVTLRIHGLLQCTMRHLPLGQLSAVSGLCAAALMAAGRRLTADPPRLSQPTHSCSSVGCSLCMFHASRPQLFLPRWVWSPPLLVNLGPHSFSLNIHSKIPMKMLMTGLNCFETIFTTKTCGVFYIVLLTGSRSTLYPTIMVWSWPEGSIPAVAWDR